MAHEVRVQIDTQIVANKDLEVSISGGEGKLGTMLISRGNLEWLPRGNSVNKYRIGWNRFAEVIEREGQVVKAKK